MQASRHSAEADCAGGSQENVEVLPIHHVRIINLMTELVVVRKEAAWSRWIRYLWSWTINPLIQGIFSGAGYFLGSVLVRYTRAQMLNARK